MRRNPSEIPRSSPGKPSSEGASGDDLVANPFALFLEWADAADATAYDAWSVRNRRNPDDRCCFQHHIGPDELQRRQP
jgi:hypothetical protein